MLAKLFVQNYALIKELDVEFETGLTIITGETGAGKSILLGALSLILGTRADTTVLLDKNEKCVVEGTFRIDDYDLNDFFTSNELDYEPHTTLRREINPAGKSRAFINDTPVTVNLLKELGDQLIDIHSQHQTLMLNDNSFQMNIIDSFAGTGKLKNEYRQSYFKYLGLKKEFAGVKELSDKNRSDLEYLNYQFIQLEEAKLREGEQAELEAEQELLEHAEEIKGALSESVRLFSEDDASILSLLREVKSNIGRIRNFLPDGEDLLKRTESSLIEIDDLAREMDKLAISIEADPKQLNIVNGRLDVIYSLIQKHRVSNLEGLISKKEEIGNLIKSIAGSDERLSMLEALLDDETKRLKLMAGEMSKMRKAVLNEIESKITDILKQLGMPNAKFRISLSGLRDFASSGIYFQPINRSHLKILQELLQEANCQE
jgi:DNA repair protein RecN (Recombination protein N)